MKIITTVTNYINRINRGHTKDLLSGSFVSVIGKVVELIVRYGFVIVLVRIVGAEEMGRYSVVIGTVMVIVTIGSLGLNSAMVKMVSPLSAHLKYDEIKTLYLTIVSKVIASGILVSILLYLSADVLSVFVFRKPYLAVYFRSFAFTVVPFMLIYLQSQAFRGMRKIAFYSLSNDIIMPLLNLVFLVIGSFFFKGGDLVRFFYLASTVFAASIVTTLWIRESKFIPSKKTETSYDKEIWQTSLPLVTSSVATQLLAWVDILLIGRLFPDSDMAIYNIAMRVAVFVGIPLIAIETATASQLSTYHKENDTHKLAIQTQKSTVLAIVVAIPIFIFLICFGKFFLSIFGNEFINSYPLMLLLLIGQFVNIITGPVGLVLTMTDKQKQYKNIIVLTSVLSVILNVLLIPRFGVTGAAWSIMITTVVKNLVLYFAVKHYFGFYALDRKYILTTLSNIRTA